MMFHALKVNNVHHFIDIFVIHPSFLMFKMNSIKIAH